jgi:hypothetical protein
MTVRLLDIDAAAYERHPVHRGERTWVETNCYIDVWVEVLHALGLDPVAAGAFTLSSDFEGDQWTFFKFPPEDLRALFGIDVGEMNVWRTVEEHVVEQLGLGRLVTVEADAWHLPDTADSYGVGHVKTTIVPNEVDVEGRRLGYFHNAGYFELSGDDYDGAFAFGPLPPYMEAVKLDRLVRPSPDELVERALVLTKDHLGRRPTTNPVLRFRKRLGDDLEWLTGQPLEVFHQWAFGACRQCGANAELAASFVGWLDATAGGGVAGAVDDFQALADAAKSLQFLLARAVRGRAVDPAPLLDDMELRWERAMDVVASRHG